MPGPLLETKLHAPRSRRALVPRPRLDDLLDRSWSATLTLVAGPAGFGKTTMLADWCGRTATGRSAAWLSLDERDRDPISFWTYVIASLRTVAPEVGAAALELLQAPQAQTGPGLESLLNDLQSLPNDLVLVLDDYHLVRTREIHEDMAFLLERLPAPAHVVIATRADPPLPLARLRAHGELVEIRARDLRFSAAETAQYLREGMNLLLDEGQVAALEQRTEGWIAALQLAALSLQGRTDVGRFIETFAGTDQYVVDYLLEEVLQRQPERVRRFLLDTSILRRLNGALCDAVTGGTDGTALLEMLNRENLFVVPLDDQRRWYRYHHLFADVLQARLQDETPERVPRIHRQASAWYAAHGDPVDAVEHAVRGEDFVAAAQLVERAMPEMRRERQEGELRRWLEALPDDLVRASPSLTIGLVGALMAQGEVDGVEERLQDAERWLQVHGTETTVLDGALRTLPSTIAMFRAGQARLRGDVDGTIAHARRAHDLSGDEDHLERGAAAALLGLAHWSSGQLHEARHCYAQALAHLSEAGHLSDVLGCTLALSDMDVAGGNLDSAAAVLRRGLSAARAAAHPPRGTADMHAGLAALHVERAELDEALRHLAAAAELADQAALPQYAYRSRVVMAQIRLAQGAPAEALDLLQDAEQVHDTDYSPDVQPIRALIARAWIAAGRPDRAQVWAEARGLTTEDDLSYLSEFEHLTLARLLLTRVRAGEADAAALDSFLRRLRVAGEEGGRPGSVIDALVMRALLARHRGDLASARSSMSEAVERAEPQRYVRTITDHGAPVLQLLRVLAARPDDYCHRLLASADRSTPEVLRIPRQSDPERLSVRELEVLQLLASDLGGPEIARRLVVSIHTVRTHTKSIYAKLGVNSRRAAVTRARELELMSHG